MDAETRTERETECWGSTQFAVCKHEIERESFEEESLAHEKEGRGGKDKRKWDEEVRGWVDKEREGNWGKRKASWRYWKNRVRNAEI